MRTLRDLNAAPAGRGVVWTAGALVAWGLANAVLPHGLPLGIVLLGLVIGSLQALTALGLVLVHRSTRIVNFAQAEIGGLAAAVAVVMVVGWRLPYLLALPVGLAAAVATGALVDVVVVRRFFTAPRLILTVATIGLAQFLAAVEIQLPHAFAKVAPLSTFKTQWDVHRRIGPIVFNGDHLVAVVVVGAVVVALAWFLGRSDTGIAIRASAESGERALLLGIPIRRLSTISWIVAAALSGLGHMLTAPILGPTLGALAGPELLLAPLAAAVLARMERLPVAFAASVGIGIAQQGVFWSYPRSSAVDLGLFALILVALLVQRRTGGRDDEYGDGETVAVREVRPVPEALASLRELRVAKRVGLAVLAVLLVGVPFLLNESRLVLASFMVISGIMAASLVVLTGWAGQISLGQFAFVGLGAATTGSLVANSGVDLFLALAVSAVVGGAAAVAIGLPALRIRGLLLAVTTLAFAVPVSTYFLNSAYFPAFTPRDVARPALFGRFDLDAPRTFYFFCLAMLGVALLAARNFRRSRVGRTVVAVRDNERAAAAYAISPVRAKLTAFTFSGALAGFAGGLYVLGVRGIGFAGFSPVKSMEIFTMVVVGGLGSLPGALAGAAYVQTAENFLHGGWALLATGGGILALLMVAPGGLGEVAYALRDRWLRRLALTKGIEVPSVVRAADERPAPAARAPTPDDGALLRCEGVEAGYGKLQVLFSADVDAREGEVLALLGTNGAGKSTLLRTVAGTLPTTSGRVVFDGRDVTDLDPIERLRLGIVTVPGGRGVFGSLSVAQNLRLAAWTYRRDRSRLDREVGAALEVFPPLRERLDERASSLSGGERQMLTLAQALMCRPRLLMIDELSLGLAPAVVARLLDVVRDLNSGGVTVILVEQSVNVATQVARRAVFMEKGQVAFTGEVRELLSRPDLLRSVFLGRAVAATSSVRARGNGRGTGRGRAAAAAPPRLAVEGITKRFGGVLALDDVALDAPDGAILGIIGANGAGKTTLFDVCSGYLRPDAGRVLLDGQDVTALAAWARADLGLGRSSQDARLFPSLTVREAVATALERHVEVREPVACTLRVPATAESERETFERADAIVERMGLTFYRDAFVSELSTGTRRIVDLACAMAHDPSVLLLDEPSSGIAQRESEALAELLLRVREETKATLVIIEHDMPLVAGIADELVCLHLGRVLARGRPRDVLADPLVVDAYLGTDETTIRRSGRTRRTKARARA